MQITGKVTSTEVSGQFKTLYIDFDDGSKTTLKITADPPEGHEIDAGDTVDVHIHHGTKSGVARHPR